MANDTQAAAPRDHFSKIAASWSHFGPPLRPSPDDTAVVQRAATMLGAGARVVVLGLTPEIVGCDWPADVRLSAVDHSPKMIEALWPPARGPANAEVNNADWCAMPIAPGTIDLVAGDGCYVLLAHPHGYDELTRAVARVLRPGGRYLIRVFLRPDQPESIADIARALAAGEVGSVHALKLRLLGALHRSGNSPLPPAEEADARSAAGEGGGGRAPPSSKIGAGTLLDDVWRAWKTMPPLPAALAGARGWTAEEITGIESYGGMRARYFLPTLAEFRQSVSSCFEEIECAFGRYELGDRCPTLVLRKN